MDELDTRRMKETLAEYGVVDQIQSIELLHNGIENFVALVHTDGPTYCMAADVVLSEDTYYQEVARKHGQLARVYTKSARYTDDEMMFDHLMMCRLFIIQP